MIKLSKLKMVLTYYAAGTDYSIGLMRDVCLYNNDYLGDIKDIDNPYFMYPKDHRINKRSVGTMYDLIEHFHVLYGCIKEKNKHKLFKHEIKDFMNFLVINYLSGTSTDSWKLVTNYL